MFGFEMRNKVEEALKEIDAKVMEFSVGTNDTYTVKLHTNEEEHVIKFRAYKTFTQTRGDFMCVSLQDNKDNVIAKYLEKSLDYVLNK
ncbi:hypothetical protein [Bacillus hominis]|uniref:hypothetical protein n=1 Tax=Bacillus hominis TaxID=2817478 RepID=UPI001BB367AC|nr:hypothetical protein [Bacillus hominis]